MNAGLEPIPLVARMLPRRWGREQVPAWCGSAPRPEFPIGEIWLSHAKNVTGEGRHLGELLAEAPQEMLGELGRVPPSLRFVLTDEPSDLIASDGAVSLWRVMEAPLDSVITMREAERSPLRTLRARCGDMFRVPSGVSLSFGSNVTALEVRADFAPANKDASVRLRRIPRTLDRTARDTWLRDAGLSVEHWTLPELSFLEPDGETCHVLMALTPGVVLDGHELSRGDAVFLPAQSRRCVLSGRGAQLLAAYPDLAPSEIWKGVRPPRPAAMALDPALVALKPGIPSGQETPLYRAA